MEASLIARVECVSAAQCDFLRLMLEESEARPLFEDEVAESQRVWFRALEDIITPEAQEARGERTLSAVWTLGGMDWEEDVRDILQALKAAKVQDVYAVLADDEGGYALRVLREGRVKAYDRWQGRELGELFGGQRDVDGVLDRIRTEHARA